MVEEREGGIGFTPWCGWRRWTRENGEEWRGISWDGAGGPGA